MPHYFKPQEKKQVTAFVDKFIANVEWIKSDDGVDGLSDKAKLDDGSISEEAMVRWLIMYTFDAARDSGVKGQDLNNLIASAILGWAMQSFDQEDRDALKPLYAEYLK